MAIPKTLVGARCKIYAQYTSAGPATLIGVFDNISYSANISTEVIHTLGRYGTQEIVVTAAEAISVDCSGFRVVGNGGFMSTDAQGNETSLNGGVPTLQELLNLDTITLTMVDRQTGDNIFSVIGCIATRYSGTLNAKATGKISISYLGTAISEDNNDQAEVGATSYPS
jgi:hypothetical protein